MASGTSVTMTPMVMASRTWRCLCYTSRTCLWLQGSCWARSRASCFGLILVPPGCCSWGQQAGGVCGSGTVSAGTLEMSPCPDPWQSVALLCQPPQWGHLCPSLPSRTTAGSSPTKTSRIRTLTPLGMPVTTAPMCPIMTSGTRTAMARGTLVTMTSMGTVSGS